MCSYNQVNNSYASQNSWTLNYLLKNELDFQGLGSYLKALWEKSWLTLFSRE